MSDLTFPITSFVLCLALTPLVKHVAHRKRWLAYPSEDRWHKKSTALMGGGAIYVAFALPTVALSDFTPLLSLRPAVHFPENVRHFGAVLWCGASLLFLLGLVDDFVKIKPHTKLVGQIMVASLVAFWGFRLRWSSSLTLDTVLTIFWVVGITNAFNLIDNMDGLCAGVGLVGALSWAAVFHGSSGPLATYSLVLAGAMAGFLVFNFHPASIFMGDSGSLTIGFALSFLSLCYAGHTAPPGGLPAYAVPLLVLMVPIFDTTLVTLIRILSGRKASVGGKDHTSHRLVLMGLSETKAVFSLYGIAALAGLSALFVQRHDSFTSPMVLVPVCLSVVLMGVYLAQIRVYPEREFSVLRNRTFTPILVELTYKQQLALVLLDFCLIAFAYYLSYRLRFSEGDFAVYFKVFLRSLPAVIACKLLAFFTMGVYRGIWRFLSINDVYVYLKATFLGTLISVAVVTYLYRFKDFSKGIFLIDWVLITGFLLGTRLSFRVFFDTMRRRMLAGDRILVYGAGRGGEILLREILNNRRLRLKPVGFVDDDRMKVGKRLQGYPIFGTAAELEELVTTHHIGGVVISFHSRDRVRTAGVRKFCKKKGLFLKQFTIKLEDVDLEG